MYKAIVSGIAALALSSSVGLAAPLYGEFARDQVNILNSYAVVPTAKQGGVASNLLANWPEQFFDGGPNPAGGTNFLSYDFTEVRNVKNIIWQCFVAGAQDLRATNATVEISSNGVTWSPVPATFSNDGVERQQLILTNAVDSRYVRVNALGTNAQINEPNRWVVRTMRMFGSPGTINNIDQKLDVISSAAVAGGVTLSAVGVISQDSSGGPGTAFQNIPSDEAGTNPWKRQILFNIGVNDGFAVQFAENYRLGKIGLYVAVAGSTGSTFLVETSLNGVSWLPVLTNSTALETTGMKFLDLMPSTANRFRLTVTSTTSTDIRFNAVQAFLIPEPATIGLLGLAIPFVMLRRTK